MSPTFKIIGFVCLISLFSAEAKAHYLIDDGIASYEDADFRAALRSFNLAARDADLSLEELLQLFEMRALVHHAMRNETAMLRDLERVAALRPTYQLGGLAPPPVREAFDEMLDANGGTLGVALVVEERTLDGKPYIVARVEKVPTGLVHRIGLQCRVQPNGRLIARTAQGTSARLPLPESGVHQGCDAKAQSRRGTVLFSASVDATPESAPAAIVIPAVEIQAMPEPLPTVVPVEPKSAFQLPQYKEPVDEPTSKKKKKWPWIVAASVLVAAGGVTAGVLIAKGSNQSQSSAGGITASW